jgi:hypothetical protein
MAVVVIGNLLIVHRGSIGCCHHLFIHWRDNVGCQGCLLLLLFVDVLQLLVKHLGSALDTPIVLILLNLKHHVNVMLHHVFILFLHFFLHPVLLVNVEPLQDVSEAMNRCLVILNFLRNVSNLSHHASLGLVTPFNVIVILHIGYYAVQESNIGVLSSANLPLHW